MNRMVNFIPTCLMSDVEVGEHKNQSLCPYFSQTNLRNSAGLTTATPAQA